MHHVIAELGTECASRAVAGHDIGIVPAIATIVAGSAIVFFAVAGIIAFAIRWGSKR